MRVAILVRRYRNVKSASALPPKADIGALLGRARNSETERLGTFEIDHQLELCWLHDWQVGRFFALDDAASIGASLPIRAFEARSI
jgi:hypothetical protein